MKTIGVTGRSGSGKSTLARALGNLGAYVLDGDQIAAGLMQPGSPVLKNVRESFGPSYFTEGGALDRKKLGERVFSDEKALTLLNAIVHPAFKDKIQGLLDDLRVKPETPDYAVIDAAVLFEAGLETICDLVVAVICDEGEMAGRIALRDGLTEEKALDRIRSQKTKVCDYDMCRRADITVISRGDPTEMEAWAERILRIAKGIRND
ncbi:MAG TPA: dephospho-CoA kinase [Bacillota bacterium]|nr:dephospho-CoA kinase [Bacillota bacterium]